MTPAQIQQLGAILSDEDSGTFVALEVVNGERYAIVVTIDEVDDDGIHRQNVLTIETDGTVTDAYEQH
jgi:hypothetical protein